MLPAVQRLKLRLFRGHVLDDVDDDRAGPAGPGDGEGLAHGVRQVADVPHQVVALGDRHGDAGDIDFLEGVLADQRQAHVAGDADDGGRVQIRRGDAGDQVGRPGAGGRKADADLAGRAGIAVRRVAGALFMSRQDMADLVAIGIQLVVYVQNRTARIAEDGIHSLLQQAFQQDFRTVQTHVDPRSRK